MLLNRGSRHRSNKSKKEGDADPSLVGSLSQEDIFNIAFGFGISASGGGGSFIQGLTIAQKTACAMGKDDKINIYNPRKYSGTGKAFVSGGIGKPESLTDPKAFGDKVTDLVTDLDKHLKANGSFFQGILPVEAGPINGLLPIYSSYNSGCWLFDCDGAGRAVPSLTTLMYDYFDNGTIPISYNYNNDHMPKPIPKNVMLQSYDKLDGADAEQIFSSVMLYGANPDPEDTGLNDSIPFTCWQFDKSMVDQDKVRFPTGTYSYWKRMGQLFKASYKSKDELLVFLSTLNLVNYYSIEKFEPLIFVSKVYEVVKVQNDRWNVGYIVFDRDDAAGTEKRLYYVNENLTISEYQSSTDTITKTYATAPSSITTFFHDDEPQKDVQINAAGGVLEAGFIPYNTGDMGKITKLCEKKVDIIVAVTDPTLPDQMNYLYENDMKQRFLDVMNGTFDQLNEENKGNYVFPSHLDEVVPLPDLKDE